MSLMSSFGRVLYTLLPVVLAGICNMVFVKSSLLDDLKIPMDAGVVCSDGKRLLGANKTWKGFLGMIVLTGFWVWFFGILGRTFSLGHGFNLVKFGDFSQGEGWLYGAVWGLGYVLFELPNSYIKRRIDIPPGTNKPGMVGILFTFIDQADSVLGCMIFMLVFYVPTPMDAVAFFILGVMVHYAVNILLFLVGLKRQMA